MNKSIQTDELSILFLSCDKYRDLWKPLFYCVNKYFNQKKYPIFLGSNTVSYNDKKVTTLLSGPDKDWSTSFLAILDQIQTHYILLWLDDMFPIKKVNSSLITNTLTFMKNNKAIHVHIEPEPKPDKVLSGGEFGEYEKGAPYRAIAMGFWDVSALKKLLIPGENPWNFEIMGSYRTSYMDGFYCAMKPVFLKMNVVEKGKIFNEAYRYCTKYNIPLNSSKRDVIRNTHFVKSELQKLMFNTVKKIPWKFRVSVMSALRKIMISY
ncbi:hypothetical protein KKB64_03255 [Patescibacteria group bacterium]|nr:hypothetical protein [Patescibacteria group bacterium]MBU1472777.1 hypothetical protein [Patescibacteria group bacterium]MBU2460043.1 hypothetical protein [Patescibacteria group bacterium]MBU2544299.1 hypothetical protein [Patescibacteria group bacterium]